MSFALQGWKAANLTPRADDFRIAMDGLPV